MQSTIVQQSSLQVAYLPVFKKQIKGIYYQKENAVYREKAHKRNIIDVSGAGDTVVSVAALALACNIEDDFLMRIANLAGGLVCEKVGVTPIQREDLLKANLV